MENMKKTAKNQEKDELISVIVPVYNVEKYLHQCLDSILAQTYINLEVILVDDGSKDNSGIICDEYADKDLRCRVIHKQNAGLGMARNSGMEIMSGEYVTFVDSDDWIDSELIENLHRAMIKWNVDFCKSGFIRFREDTKLKTVHYMEEYFSGDEARKKLLPRMIGSSPSQHDSVEMCVCGALYKTKIIKEYRVVFPSERILISEDMVFNIDYMQYSTGGLLIPVEGYMYRYNPVSLTSQYRDDRFKAVCFFYDEMKKKLLEYGYTNDAIDRLRRILFVYLRMCFAQEKKSVSGHNVKKSIEQIESICSNKKIRKIIEEYPIDKLGFKQALFLRLIQGRKTYILKAMIEFGII